MALHSKSSSNWLLSLKVLLTSTAVFTVAVVLKLSIPVMVEFVVSDVPLMWSLGRSWLSPPYLYLLINCIIITIVASSKLQSKAREAPQEKAAVEDDATTYGVVLPNAVNDSGFRMVLLEDKLGNVEEYANVLGTKTTVNVNSSELDSGNGCAISKSSRATLKKDSAEYPLTSEKPLVSARLGHRKAVKATPEGVKALGVSKPKRHDTLESTWKTITDGRPMPLTRHLKKSDTWDSLVRQQDPAPPKMSKSEAFNSSSGCGSVGAGANSTQLTRSRGSGKLRREPSPGQDELNRRVEAFINKFNEEMRLQRQESLNQFQEMISRGA